MARPRITALPLLFTCLLLLPPPTAAHGEVPWAFETMTFYVHDFSDAEQHEYSMDTMPPTGESEQAGTCTACAGAPAAEYNFTTASAFDQELDLDAEDPGTFTFWIRAFQPQEGVGVPPLDTTVRFRLMLDDGTVIGAGSQTKQIAGLDPEKFEATFVVSNVTSLRPGVKLVWNVQITTPNNRYTPNAAPYGVSEEHPFSVSLVVIRPVPDSTLVVQRATNEMPRATEGQDARVNITVTYLGPGETFVFLEVKDLPRNASALLLDAGGQPTGGLALQMEQTVQLTLVVKGLTAGAQTVRVDANGTKGETASAAFRIDVAAPPPPPKEDGGGLPGPSAFALLLAAAAILALLRRRR